MTTRQAAEVRNALVAEGFPPWGSATPGTLDFLLGCVDPGWRTLETGCGATTVLLAALGAEHVCISPDAAEHEAIRSFCSRHSVPRDHLELTPGFSDTELPSIVAERNDLDLVLVDGAHAFPNPVIDWYYAARATRVGGLVVIDDVPIPSVALVYRHMTLDPGWEPLGLTDERTAVFRKVANEPVGDPWLQQAFNQAGYPDYSFLTRRRQLERNITDRWHQSKRAAAARLPRVARAVRRMPKW